MENIDVLLDYYAEQSLASLAITRSMEQRVAKRVLNEESALSAVWLSAVIAYTLVIMRVL